MRLAQECRKAGQWTEHSVLLVVALDDHVGRGLLRDLGVQPALVPIKADEIPTALGICDCRLLALLLEEIQPTVAHQILAPLPNGLAYVLVVALGGATLVVRKIRAVINADDA